MSVCILGGARRASLVAPMVKILPQWEALYLILGQRKVCREDNYHSIFLPGRSWDEREPVVSSPASVVIGAHGGYHLHTGSGKW